MAYFEIPTLVYAFTRATWLTHSVAMSQSCSRCQNPLSPEVVPPSRETESWCHTNISPPLRDRQIFKKNLTDIRERHRNVRRSITLREEELAALRQEEVRLSTYAETYRRILHPARYLPEVVLREIFQACVDTETDEVPIAYLYGEPTFIDSLDSSKAPWTLGQVCHRWRVVALLCSFLWSHVAFSLVTCISGTRLSRLMLQLQRSKAQPLTVFLHSSPPNIRYNNPHNQLSPLLIALCTHSNRWETIRVSFCIASLNIVKNVASMVMGNIPALRHLYVHSCDPIPFGEMIDGFRVAPELKHFSFHGVDSDPASFILLPWGQITRFRGYWIRRVNYDSMDCISQMHRLQDWAYIGAFGPQLFPIGLFAPLQLSLGHLHTLHLYPAYSTGMHAILDTFTLPQLRILRITGEGNRIPGLPAFLTRVAQTLRSLCLELRSLACTEVVSMLESVPALESLHVSCASNEVINALSEFRHEDEDTLRLLPSLREIGVFHPHDFHGTTFLRMVENRLCSEIDGNSGQCYPGLRKILYNGGYSTGMDRTTQDHLQFLRFSGLEVNSIARHWATTAAV